MAFSVKNLSQTFSGGSYVLDDFSFEVAPREIVAVIGRNGCGKTSLLRLLAGLAMPSQGKDPSKPSQVDISGFSEDCRIDRYSWRTTLPKHTSMVFQDYNGVVFPWQRVHEALSWVRPEADRYFSDTVASFTSCLPAERESYWGRLSGGQKQAVAVVRGLLRAPDVLLMDEPFSSIDALSRRGIAEGVVDVVSRSTEPRSVVVVTHDIDEAVFMADRIVIVDGPPLKKIDEVVVESSRSKRTDGFRSSAEFVKKREEIFTFLERR